METDFHHSLKITAEFVVFAVEYGVTQYEKVDGRERQNLE